MTPETGRAFDLDADEGVIISSIEPTGPAAEANLRPGDLILEVNGREVASIDEFRSVLDDVEKGQVLRLLIERRGNLFYTTIKAG